MNKINTEDINMMSYTDFIGFINQWNVLPGAYNTLSKWGTFSHINSSSRILELACTSGFSIREICNLFGGSGVGLDISIKSIEMANYNKKKYTPDLNIDYIVANAEEYKNTERFSHVIIGAALAFFSSPENTIKKITKDYLKVGGFLLASPFYVISDIPKNLINEAKNIFGITITTTGYKETLKLYKDFEVIYEDRCQIIEESEDELIHYCNSTVERVCTLRNINEPEVKQAMYGRLMKIKIMSNKLRPYQNYSVLVLRYRDTVYPNRYTELF